jgi:hypothetical protein
MAPGRLKMLVAPRQFWPFLPVDRGSYVLRRLGRLISTGAMSTSPAGWRFGSNAIGPLCAALELPQNSPGRDHDAPAFRDNHNEEAIPMSVPPDQTKDVFQQMMQAGQSMTKAYMDFLTKQQSGSSAAGSPPAMPMPDL